MRRQDDEHMAGTDSRLSASRYAQGQAKKRPSAFSAKIDELQARLASGETALLAESARFLRRWFVEQILGADAAYVQTLANAGLADLP